MASGGSGLRLALPCPPGSPSLPGHSRQTRPQPPRSKLTPAGPAGPPGCSFPQPQPLSLGGDSCFKIKGTKGSPARAGYRLQQARTGRASAGRGLCTLPAARAVCYVHFPQTLCPAQLGTRDPPTPRLTVWSALQCPRPGVGRRKTPKEREARDRSVRTSGRSLEPRVARHTCSFCQQRPESIHPVRHSPWHPGVRPAPSAVGLLGPLLASSGLCPRVSLPEPSALFPGLMALSESSASR